MFSKVKVKEVLNSLNSDEKKQYQDFKKMFDKKVKNRKYKKKITAI